MPMSWCCNTVSEKHVLAPLLYYIKKNLPLQCSEFFQDHSLSWGHPQLQQVSHLEGSQVFVVVSSHLFIFTGLPHPLTTTSDSGAVAMGAEICRQLCVQPQDAVQALGTCISLFRNGWLYIFFAFCRDTVSYCVQVMQAPKLTHFCVKLLFLNWENSLNSQHAAWKQSNMG